ncbi:hypothetical protein [Pseudarthrobacter sp. DSP2-3-2b1]|uniref:hypothetical protein n=1 Tax=Pseudarthrobacter sp. DSP2-3-2b1 TaxID=2804661 RepID=UPI003CF3BF97
MHRQELQLSAGRGVRRSGYGWILGPVAVGLGLVAHLLSGGPPPRASVLIAVAALAGMLAAVAGRFQLRTWAVLLASGLAQQVLHLAFTGLAAVEADSAVPHDHRSLIVPDLAVPTPHVQSMELMIDLHAAAAVVTLLLVILWDRIASGNPGKERRSGVQRAPDDADA